MKRIIAFLMAIIMCISLTACSNSNGGGEDEEWEEIVEYEDVTVSKDDKVSEEEKTDKKDKEDKEETLVSKDQEKTNNKVEVSEKKEEGLIASKELTPQEKLFEKQKAALKGSTVVIVSGSDDVEKVYPQEKYAATQLRDKWGVKIERKIYSNAQLPKMITTLVASGNPPDVAHVATTNLVRYVYANLAVPIDSYIVKDDPVWDNGEAFEGFKFGGKTYGISWNVILQNNFFIWYNKTYLKEKGAEDPYTLYKKDKWDTEAFKRVAKKAVTLQSNKKDVATYGAYSWDPSVFLAMYGATGVTENKDGKWSVTIDSAKAMEALQMIRDLSMDGSIKINSLGNNAGNTYFKDRKVAMVLERNKNAIGNYDYYNTMDDEIGLVPLPKAPDGKYYGYTVADGSFLLKNGKNPLAAIAYRYYDRLFTQHTSRDEQLAAGYDKYEKSLISKEHEKIATEYINKVCSKPLDDKLYALSNWVQGDGLSQQFWNSLTVEGKQPAQVVDSAKAQITKCLKETVGIGNVK